MYECGGIDDDADNDLGDFAAYYVHHGVKQMLIRMAVALIAMIVLVVVFGGFLSG